jgi:hypothetical protein
MKRKIVTTTIPKSGNLLFGGGKWASYEAAKRGDIPTIKVGERYSVPVVWLEQKLGVEDGDLDELLADG